MLIYSNVNYNISILIAIFRLCYCRISGPGICPEVRIYKGKKTRFRPRKKLDLRKKGSELAFDQGKNKIQEKKGRKHSKIQEKKQDLRSYFFFFYKFPPQDQGDRK